MLSLVRLQILRASKGVLARIDDKYLILGLHVHLTEKKTAQLGALFTEEELPVMMKRQRTMLLMRCFCLVPGLLTETLAFRRRAV